MGHTPYGYRIENGMAVVDGEQATAVKKLFEGYLSGLGLQAAADAAGIPVNHCQAKRMMLNKKYLGTDYYPALITADMVTQVKQELSRRAEGLGRIYEPKEKQVKTTAIAFSMRKVEERYSDPYQQAEYAYSLIKEVVQNG